MDEPIGMETCRSLNDFLKRYVLLMAVLTLHLNHHLNHYFGQLV
jgi:hypothetical protein